MRPMPLKCMEQGHKLHPFSARRTANLHQYGITLHHPIAPWILSVSAQRMTTRTTKEGKRCLLPVNYILLILSAHRIISSRKQLLVMISGFVWPVVVLILRSGERYVLDANFVLPLSSCFFSQGPHGPKTLCNACGLRWAKRTRRPESEMAAPSNSTSLDAAEPETEDSPLTAGFPNLPPHMMF